MAILEYLYLYIYILYVRITLVVIEAPTVGPGRGFDLQLLWGAGPMPTPPASTPQGP